MASSPESSVSASNASILQKPLKLPCGSILKNRLAKSCMSDSLGNGRGQPTLEQTRLYERWAQGGAALSCIGECQVLPYYPEKPGNLVLSEGNKSKLWQTLTRRGTIDKAHLWPQLGHAGALAHTATQSNPKGPSELTVPEQNFHCEALSLEEVQALPKHYARAARQAQTIGFSGVMIHAGHGFLLSQFLSPLFNKRQDDYGGDVAKRCRLILDILAAVRTAVGPTFPVAIRINCTDQMQGGLTQEDALHVIRLLDEHTSNVDLIDISGGTYFPGAKAASDATKKGGGPYFIDFARQARQVTSIPLMLTGGFKKRQDAIDALESGAVDMIGVARAMVLNPSLAKDWMNSSKDVDPFFPRFEHTVPGGVTAWFTMRLTALAEDKEDVFDMDLPTAVKVYAARDAKRVAEWKEEFGMK